MKSILDLLLSEENPLRQEFFERISIELGRDSTDLESKESEESEESIEPADDSTPVRRYSGVTEIDESEDRATIAFDGDFDRSEIHSLEDVVEDDKAIEIFVDILANKSTSHKWTYYKILSFISEYNLTDYKILSFISKYNLLEYMKEYLLKPGSKQHLNNALHKKDSLLYKIFHNLTPVKIAPLSRTVTALEALTEHSEESHRNNLFRYGGEAKFGPLEYTDKDLKKSQLEKDWKRAPDTTYIYSADGGTPQLLKELLQEEHKVSPEKKEADPSSGEEKPFKSHKDVTDFFRRHLFQRVEDEETQSLLVQEAARHYYQAGLFDAPTSLLFDFFSGLLNNDQIRFILSPISQIEPQIEPQRKEFIPRENGVTMRSSIPRSIKDIDSGEETPLTLYSEIDFRCDGHAIIIDVKNVHWETKHEDVNTLLRGKTMENEYGQPYREEVTLQVREEHKLEKGEEEEEEEGDVERKENPRPRSSPR